ncbi:MAG: HEAT repeat domain-containing protein [bacterium]|nr:HEAT repeat domain-containing protein [bacterium]
MKPKSILIKYVKYLLPIVIIIVAIPTAAFAIDSQTLDNLIFLLSQPEPVAWNDSSFDDATLIEGFTTIYELSLDNDTPSQLHSVIWAMGETGLEAFVPILIGELENEPTLACYALGKISCDDSVDALIPMLENEDRFVREAAVWGLGNITYGENLEEAKSAALDKLNERLTAEDEAWIVDMIGAAIELIETGIITSPVFDQGIENR